MTSLHVGMIAPISHGLPPDGYGPWERVAFDLAEGLVSLGQRVTVFAPAGARLSGELVATVAHPLDVVGEGAFDARVLEELHVATAVEHAAAGGFDVLHSHLHVHALGFSRLVGCPLVSTLHGSAWNREHHPMLAAYREMPFVSISDAERALFPTLNYVGTVWNGIDVADFPPGDGSGGYLLFAGRMAPEKAPDEAVEIARRAEHPLVMVGGIEAVHGPFFEARVRPLLRDAGIEYLGPVSREELVELYRHAVATLMPLRWDEPFGLVVVESLACGTPVVASRRGAMPELVRHGETGFLFESRGAAVAAVGRVATIDRSRCRADAEARFSREAMARGYLEVFLRVLEAGTAAARTPFSAPRPMS